MVSSKRRDNQQSAYRVEPEDVDDSESLHVEVDETLGETAAVAEVVIPGPHLPVLGDDAVHGSLEVHGALVSELLHGALEPLVDGDGRQAAVLPMGHDRLKVAVWLGGVVHSCHAILSCEGSKAVRAVRRTGRPTCWSAWRREGPSDLSRCTRRARSSLGDATENL